MHFPGVNLFESAIKTDGKLNHQNLYQHFNYYMSGSFHAGVFSMDLDWSCCGKFDNCLEKVSCLFYVVTPNLAPLCTTSLDLSDADTNLDYYQHPTGNNVVFCSCKDSAKLFKPLQMLPPFMRFTTVSHQFTSSILQVHFFTFTSLICILADKTLIHIEHSLSLHHFKTSFN